MTQSNDLVNKWQPVLEHPELDSITDAHKKATIATLLENQEIAAREQSNQGGSFAPT